ncbi:MAG: DUF445 family protein, partial [Clostridiales Family XIII bacterium]|nr:DUF445 family protein [Clostridiales Family XIII bacterium]
MQNRTASIGIRSGRERPGEVRLSGIHIISGPLIGGLIGLVTNYIAIRMLFRPLKPLYIGRFKLPFTPGVVPRRKEDLANILGRAVVAKFFNADDLELVFTSDSLSNAFAESIADLLGSEELAPRDLAGAFADGEGFREALDAVKEELCVRILAGILKADPASVLARAGAKSAHRRFQGAFAEKLGDEIAASVAEALSRDVEAYVLSEGRSVIMPLLDAELDELSRAPVGSRVNAAFRDRDVLVGLIRGVYDRFMRAYVRPIVSTIDVGGMITEKVKGMDAAEIEGLV